MVGRGIFLRRLLTKFRSEPTTRSDGIGRKPDTGRDSIMKNAVFWWFSIKLTVLMVIYRVEIFNQVVRDNIAHFVQVLAETAHCKLVI